MTVFLTSVLRPLSGYYRAFVFLLALSLALSLSGCSALPSSGPTSSAILAAAERDRQVIATYTNYRLIDLTPLSLPRSVPEGRHLFPQNWLKQALLVTDQKVRAGDSLLIHLWEGADNGLFTASGQRDTILALKVSNSGMIAIPYVGDLKVVGKSVYEIRHELITLYKGKAIEPEINVDIGETESQSLSVLGSAEKPGRLKIPSQGARLYDVLAMAGGTSHPTWEVTLRVTRQNRSASLRLDKVYASDQNNIVILPGDSLLLTHLSRQFSVYGALSKQGKVSVNQPVASLSDVLAAAGGLNDFQAEARSIFIFRGRPDVGSADKAGQEKPLVFRLDFTKPDTFLLASQFEVEPDDIIYVASADTNRFQKFTSALLSPFFSATTNIQDLSN